MWLILNSVKHVSVIRYNIETNHIRTCIVREK